MPMTAEQLHQGWSPRRIGRRILVLPETASTNTAALEAVAGPAASGGPHPVSGPDADGLVVLADYQTAGRGRQGRTWSSPRGASVLCSALILLKERPHVGGWLTLASAVAACEAIRQATEVAPAIKWPNNLRVSGRKLGGILIESRRVGADRLLDADTRAWVVGIGINCLQQRGHFPPELRDTATSLELEASHPVDRVAVARALLRCLDKWMADPAPEDDNSAHAAWLNHAEPIGQRVCLRRGGREYAGRTVAVDPSGGLIVQGDDGRREWFDPMVTTLL